MHTWQTTEGRPFHYEYVTVDFANNPVFQARTDGEHRRVIDERAAAGQRFCGMVPTVSGANGKILQYDLIFEVEGEARR